MIVINVIKSICVKSKYTKTFAIIACYVYKQIDNFLQEQYRIMSYSKGILYSANDIKISQLKELLSSDIILSDTDQKIYKKASQRCQDNNVFVYAGDDNNYHFKFPQIYSAPYVMYGKGNYDLLHKQCIAIVGPRKYSPYAHQVMESLFDKLTDYDVATISWLADGVDKMCHELSIKAGIPTIAILGWGLKYYLESKDRELIQKIVANWWLVLSEFKLNSRPERYTFPQRNRIVAGLSDMVFLPEASEKSWSLITVDFARQMHKDVYGTPNSIFSPTSQWLHQYMQQWLVMPVVNWEWMLSKYFGKKTQDDIVSLLNQSQDENLLSTEYSRVVQIVQKNPNWLWLNEIVSQIELWIEEVMSQLSMAEVIWQIRNDWWIWKIKY